jgi:citronellol/citronellal dehydrogenase
MTTSDGAGGSVFRSAFRPGLFNGHVFLVTGGGTGIGRCIAHELASLGARPVLSGRHQEPLQATADEIAEAGGEADVRSCDVRDETQVAELIRRVVEGSGRLDGVVNNAGGQFPSPAEGISPNGWRSVVDLNLTGTFLVTREAFNAWFAEHGGTVVSIAAEMWNGFPFMAHTGAARAGVVNLTKTLAVEWANRGVRVNAVAPGLVYSSGMDTYDEQVQRAAAATGTKVPAGRVGTESEVSAATAFLLSPAAAFITGETLKIDGGASLARQPQVPLGEVESTQPFRAFHLARDVPDFWSGSG